MGNLAVTAPHVEYLLITTEWIPAQNSHGDFIGECRGGAAVLRCAAPYYRPGTGPHLADLREGVHLNADHPAVRARRYPAAGRSRAR